MNVKLYGADVSEANGNIDLSAYGFVIIRAGYGDENGGRVDARLMQYVRQCERLKKPYGLYWYSYSIDVSTAKSEAEYFLKTIKSLGELEYFKLGCWLDMEDGDGYKVRHGFKMTKANVSAISLEFCKTIEEAGYYTGIYASQSWLWMLAPDCNRFDKWVANWEHNDGTISIDTSHIGTLRQYCAKDGVDRNAMYVDIDHYTKRKGGKAEMKPRTKLGNFNSSKWMDYAVNRTNVAMPNCFTYATARISEILGKNQPLDGTRVRGAGDLWEGHNKAFTKSYEPQPGALMIWTGGWENAGHVAICEEVHSGSHVSWSCSNYAGAMFQFLTGNPETFYSHYGLRFAGYLVHKDLKHTKVTHKKVGHVHVIPEKGHIHWTNDVPVRVHKGSPNGPVVATYQKGDPDLSYWGKWIGNGHRYAVYTGASGSTNFVAVSGSETYGVDKWGEAY